MILMDWVLDLYSHGNVEYEEGMLHFLKGKIDQLNHNVKSELIQI